MRQCLLKYYFTLSSQNPHNIRDIVAILFSLCLIGLALWSIPWIGYQVIECDYSKNNSMDCKCQLEYTYMNCFLPGLLVLLAVVLFIILLLMICYLSHRFYTIQLPIWRDNIERSIKPISFIIAARDHGGGESQHLINSIPPRIYNRKWTQLKFMISDDNPDSLISRDQKIFLLILSIILSAIGIIALLSPYFGTLLIRKYCSGNEGQNIAYNCKYVSTRCVNQTITSDNGYIGECFEIGLFLQLTIIFVSCITVLIIMLIGGVYTRIKTSVLDLPEIIALQGVGIVNSGDL